METEEIATRHQYIRGYIKKTNREELIRAIHQDGPNTDLVFGYMYDDSKFIHYSISEVIKSSQSKFNWKTYRAWLSAGNNGVQIDGFSDNCLTDKWGGVPEDHVHILKYDIFIPLFCKITEPFPLVSLWMEAKYEFIINTDPKMIENEDQSVVAYFWRFYKTEFFIDRLFSNIKDNKYQCFLDKEKTKSLDQKNFEFIKTGDNSTDLNFIFYIDVDGHICEFQYNSYLAFLRPITPLKMVTYQEEQFIDVRFYVLLMVNVLKGFAVIELKFDPLKLE